MSKTLFEELNKIMISELGDMGQFVIKKQCKALNVDYNNIQPSDLPKMADALSASMKLFGTEKAKNVYNKILKLKDLDSIVESETDLSKKLEDLIHLASTRSNAGEWEMARMDYGEALKLAKELKDKEKAAKVHRAIGNLALRNGDYRIAEDNFGMSLMIAQELKNNKEIIESLRSMGNGCWRKGSYDIALGFLKDALRKAKNAKDDEAIAQVYMAKANIYDEKGEYEKGIGGEGFLKNPGKNFIKERKYVHICAYIGNFHILGLKDWVGLGICMI